MSSNSQANQLNNGVRSPKASSSTTSAVAQPMFNRSQNGGLHYKGAGSKTSSLVLSQSSAASRTPTTIVANLNQGGLGASALSKSAAKTVKVSQIASEGAPILKSGGFGKTDADGEVVVNRIELRSEQTSRDESSLVSELQAPSRNQAKDTSQVAMHDHYATASALQASSQVSGVSQRSDAAPNSPPSRQSTTQHVYRQQQAVNQPADDSIGLSLEEVDDVTFSQQVVGSLEVTQKQTSVISVASSTSSQKQQPGAQMKNDKVRKVQKGHTKSSKLVDSQKSTKSVVGQQLLGDSRGGAASTKNASAAHSRKQSKAVLHVGSKVAKNAAQSSYGASSQSNAEIRRSTLDPANPLAHTTVTRAKKVPLKDRVSLAGQQRYSAATPGAHPQHSPGKTRAQISPRGAKQHSFKMYNTMSSDQQNHPLAQTKAFDTLSNVQTSPLRSARTLMNSGGAGGTRSSLRSPLGQRPNGVGVGGAGGLSRSPTATSKEQAAIIHSQEMMKKSREARLNSGGRLASLLLEEESNGVTSLGGTENKHRLQQMFASGPAQSSDNVTLVKGVSSHHDLLTSMRQLDHTPSAAVSTFDAQMGRDETVLRLKQQLDTERKRHSEIKLLFDEVVGTMQAQNSRAAHKEAIEAQASKAVEEIIKKGSVSNAELLAEVEKLKQTVSEQKQRETELQSQTSTFEKQLLHAQMRTKESQARERIASLKAETVERKLHMEIERLKEQVKDCRNSEEQLKSDHAQKMLEMSDQIEETRARQATEDEDRYLHQICEIKREHAREKETLVQQKFAATQELQMIKMDHSELIRNTNFEEQRDLVETITALQAQIQHLQLLLQEQGSKFELRESQLLKDQKTAQTKSTQLEGSLERAKTQKAELEKEMASKCKTLEDKLEKATQEKDKVYKKQMDKIHENIEQLKDQITSTNQSLIDQSYMGPSSLQSRQREHSSVTRGVIARLQSPDFQNRRHRRGDPLSASSPRVPRAIARLQSVPDNNVIAQGGAQFTHHQRVQSPLQAQAAAGGHHVREKSGDLRATGAFITGGSEMLQDMTQLMSNGTAEQTMNLGAQTAGQALFNQTALPAGQPQTAAMHNSFLLDPVFNDYYVEYVMLHKLRTLTNSFLCNQCHRDLSFSDFFDETEHDCPCKVPLPMSGLSGQGDHGPVQVRHSHIGSDYAEEFKEARAMFGAADPSAIHDEGQTSVDGGAMLMPGSAQSQKHLLDTRSQRSHTTYFKRSTGGISNPSGLAKTTLNPATVQVAEINLAATSRNRMNQPQTSETVPMTTGSFHQSSTTPGLELGNALASVGAGGALDQVTRRHTQILMPRSTGLTPSANAAAAQQNSRAKVNSMQLEVYVMKIKEYRHKIEATEAELDRFKQENESLIFDLRDSKTKVAVLEESKAQLQIELARLKKSQSKKANQTPADKDAVNGKRSPRTPTTLDMTANAQSFGGVFGGSKQNMSVKVQPALTQSQNYQQPSEIRYNGMAMAAGRIDPEESMRLRGNQSDRQAHERATQDPPATGPGKALFRSPQSRMVPLSQKFSAFPTSELKQRSNRQIGGGGGGVNNTTMLMYSQMGGGANGTRNYGHPQDNVSLQSSSGQATRSYNNLTSNLNSSVQQNVWLRNGPGGGAHSARPDYVANGPHHHNNEPVEVKYAQPVTGSLDRGGEGREETKTVFYTGAHRQERRVYMDNSPPCRGLGNYNPRNESCDISPDHGSNDIRQMHHRNQQPHPRLPIAGEMDYFQGQPEMDADLSSMNPLVTPGLDVTGDNLASATTNNRCSLLDAQQVDHEKSGSGQSPQAAEFGRSQRIIKLNNPYDEISIRRKQLLEDSPSTPKESPRLVATLSSPGRQSQHQVGAMETRQTIFPGLRKQRKQTEYKNQMEAAVQQTQYLEASQTKYAVPIAHLRIGDQTPVASQRRLDQMNKAAGGQGFSALSSVHKSGSKNPYDDAADEPFRVEDLDPQ